MWVSLPLAQAGDRKDSAASDARSDSRFSDFVTNSSPRHGGAEGLFVANSDSKFSRSHADATKKEKESGPTPVNERKKIILFRFDPKFGDVTLQPVIGPVKGAQICVGF
jgi:hypothetical protein